MLDKHGYGIKDPQEEDGVWGIDALGDEIMYGDKIVEIGGEYVLLTNLQEYWDKNCDIEYAE